MKLLITGFTPFGGEKLNPSWEAVKRLPDRVGETELIRREIPTAFDESGAALRSSKARRTALGIVDAVLILI